MINIQTSSENKIFLSAGWLFSVFDAVKAAEQINWGAGEFIVRLPYAMEVILGTRNLEFTFLAPHTILSRFTLCVQTDLVIYIKNCSIRLKFPRGNIEQNL